MKPNGKSVMICNTTYKELLRSPTANENEAVTKNCNENEVCAVCLTIWLFESKFCLYLVSVTFTQNILFRSWWILFISTILTQSQINPINFLQYCQTKTKITKKDMLSQKASPYTKIILQFVDTFKGESLIGRFPEKPRELDVYIRFCTGYTAVDICIGILFGTMQNIILYR